MHKLATVRSYASKEKESRSVDHLPLSFRPYESHPQESGSADLQHRENKRDCSVRGTKVIGRGQQ